MTTQEMVLAKVVHPGAIKLTSGVLSGPINRIIKMSLNDAELLRSRGVKVSILSKIERKAPLTVADLEKKRKVVAVSKKEEVEETPETVDEKEEEVKDTANDEVSEETEDVEEETEETPETVDEKEEEVKDTANDEVSEETEDVEEETEETPETDEQFDIDKDEDGDGEADVTPEYIKNCDNLQELRSYAKQLGIDGKKLSRARLKKLIIEELTKGE